MRIVVDVSVTLKWVFDEPESDAAFALRDSDLIAPVLWLAEAANALWRKARIGEITADQTNGRLSELQMAPVAPIAVEPHLASALRLAMQIGHPVYDCLYLAVAVHADTYVVTADGRFAAAAARAGFADRVRLLGS